MPLTPVNGPTLQPYSDGIRNQFAAASSQFIDCGTGPDVTFDGVDLTIAVRYSLTNLPADGSSYQLFSRDNNSGGRSYTTDVRNFPAEGFRIYVNGGNSGQQLVEGRTPVAGDDRFVIAFWAPSSDTSQIWINGSLSASSTASVAIPTATTSARIGARTYDSFQEYLNGSVGFVAAWNRRLTANEIIALSANPWQIFAPDRRVLYFGAGGGTSGTIYESTYAESKTLADVLSSLVIYNSTYTETKTLTDAVSTVVDFTSTYSESTTLSDTDESTLGASIYNRDYAETITLEDSYSTNLSALSTVTDAITLTETYAGSGVFQSTISETTTLGDSEVGDSGILRDYVETVTLGDSYSTLIIGNVDITETITLEDSPSTIAVLNSTIEETGTFVDQFVGNLTTPSSGTVDLTPEAIDAIADEVMLRLYENPVRRL